MTLHNRPYVIEKEHYETHQFHFEYVIKKRESGKVLYRTMGANYARQILGRLNK